MRRSFKIFYLKHLHSNVLSLSQIKQRNFNVDREQFIFYISTLSSAIIVIFVSFKIDKLALMMVGWHSCNHNAQFCTISYSDHMYFCSTMQPIFFAKLWQVPNDGNGWTKEIIIYAWSATHLFMSLCIVVYPNQSINQNVI